MVPDLGLPAEDLALAPTLWLHVEAVHVLPCGHFSLSLFKLFIWLYWVLAAAESLEAPQLNPLLNQALITAAPQGLPGKLGGREAGVNG